MDNLISFSKLTLGIMLFGLVFALPSGISAWFDGLPWVNATETLAVFVVVPFLLILGWRFLALRLPMLFLSVLLVLKIVLFVGSPSGGWLIKVDPNLTQEQSAKYHPFQLVEGDSWIKTYATSWNKNASGILKNSWTQKPDFPLDWVLMGSLECGVSGVKCWEEVNPIIDIEGVLVIPEGKKFVLLAEGVQDGTLLAINDSGEDFVLLPSANIKEATLQQYQLPRDGKWRVSGKLHYAGANWSLIPALVDSNGGISSDLGREVLWQDERVDHIGFYKTLSMITDGGIIIFLLAWIVWMAGSLVQLKILNIPFAVFSGSAIVISFLMVPVFAYMFQVVGLFDPTTASYLGLSITMAGTGFLIWVLWKKDLRNFQADRIVPSVLLFFGPALLLFFVNREWSVTGQWANWGAGDDWTSYQFFARKIVVEGEWLNAGEGVFIMQPFYRYFVGVYHWLFGQSAFVQHMADVWCVLGATIILASLANKLRLSAFIIFIACGIYLVINLIGAFRYHIGISLVENHAMILMMLAAWLLYKAREGGRGRIVLAALFGSLGFWTRLDHLGAIAGLAFLAFEPVEGPTGGWKGYWERLKLHWDRLALYWGGGIFSVLVLCYRNWWLGGAFYPVDNKHANLILDLPRGDYYQIITGVTWLNFPPISGVVVAVGTFIALLALVWRPKVLQCFPLSLGITLIGLMAPFAFLTVTGYAPRFSIHLLPLAILSLAIFVHHFLTDYKFPRRGKQSSS